MTDKLDAKFYGVIRKAKDDTIVPDDQWMLFLAKDNVFAEWLPKYREGCVLHDCDADQIAAIDRGIERLNAWRAATDAKGEKLLG
jgi:hypothetical protein